VKRKISYWTAIGLFSMAMTGSALGYLSGSQQMAEAFQHLGYPDYFRMLLGVAKLLGVAALLAPRVPVVVREWAFAGFAITMIAAVISHLASGDSIGMALGPVIAFVLLIVARALWRSHSDHRARQFDWPASSSR